MPGNVVKSRHCLNKIYEWHELLFLYCGIGLKIVQELKPSESVLTLL
jgi:hypothetical protein